MIGVGLYSVADLRFCPGGGQFFPKELIVLTNRIMYCNLSVFIILPSRVSRSRKVSLFLWVRTKTLGKTRMELEQI